MEQHRLRKSRRCQGDRTYKITITLSNGDLSDVQNIDILLQNVGEETDAPVVSDLTFTPKEINVESSAQTVVAEFRVQDISGIKRVNLNINDERDEGVNDLPSLIFSSWRKEITVKICCRFIRS